CMTSPPLLKTSKLILGD
ncbi:hypothetical protein A2U01_0058721, partial [Trifolium medium]|nr:hypothetical protein [Trifolium medium]